MTDQTSQQAFKIQVDSQALREVLAALSGPGHFIRELQATRGPLFNNPIDKLIDEFNAYMKHAQQAVESDRDNLEGMAECMRMFRADMIKAGVIGESVPPMFMTEAILGAIGKARAEALEQRVDDLAALVGRLVRALNKATPHNVLSYQAMNYLKRHGLQGSPLRGQHPAQADKPDIESTHAARAIAAYEASGATKAWTYLDPTEWSKWEKIADAVHAISKG